MTTFWILLFGIVIGVALSALFCLLALVPTAAPKPPKPTKEQVNRLLQRWQAESKFSLTARKADAPGKHGTGSAHTEARGVTPGGSFARRCEGSEVNQNEKRQP